MSVDSKMTAIADAIRAKTGGTEVLTLDGMAEAIASIEAGGGDDLAAQVVDRTVSEFSSSVVEKVGTYAFYGCGNLTSVDLPACSEVAAYAFHRVTKLTTVNLPACATVGSYAFTNCSKLANINLTTCKTIGSYTFSECALSRINVPLCTSLGTYAFYGCGNLTSVDLPACTSINNNAFQTCTNLASVELPVCTSIASVVFANCTNLASVVLRNEDVVCTLKNANTFTNTPIESGTGYIYVPDVLVEDYKAATNWSTYASQIKPLSEYVEVTA